MKQQDYRGSTSKRRFRGGDDVGDKNGNNNQIQEFGLNGKERWNKSEVEEDELRNMGTIYLLFIGVCRFLACLGWTGGITWATLHVYWTAEGHLPFQREPVMNPGLFSDLLGRGRDSSDYEWVALSPMLWTKFIFANGIYQGMKLIVSHHEYLQKLTPWISPGISVILFCNTIGITPTIHMIIVPVIYWLALRSRRKVVIWALTFGLIFHIGSPILHAILGLPDGFQDYEMYFFVVASAWMLCRGVSFCMDVWERTEEEKFGIQSLLLFQQYMFYLPLVPCGPLITFEHFEREVILKMSRSSKTEDFYALGKNLLKLMATSFLIELIYHYLYFRALSMTIPLIYDMNIWAVCGTVYWLGHIFTLKYKVLYGLPSCLAEFDGLSMYPLVSCPAYIHRYSVLWKDFDRGLYTFMVKYIYGPLMRTFNSADAGNIFPSDLKKLAASFLTFVFVFIWHSTSFDVMVWTAYNFLGITFEKIGSLIKRKIDGVQKLRPITWDFIIEPIITIPLAAMSILNSSIFCGKYESAVAFYDRLSLTWTASYNYHVWICCFLYCFTHVGVTVRTWKPFSKAIISRLSHVKSTKQH